MYTISFGAFYTRVASLNFLEHFLSTIFIANQILQCLLYDYVLRLLLSAGKAIILVKPSRSYY